MDRIRELRLEKDLKQKELAEILGIQPNTFNQYEMGKREPDYATLLKIANYFDVTIDYLLGNTEIKKGSATPKGDGPATEREQLLLEKFRAASPAIQELVLKALKDMDGREG